MKNKPGQSPYPTWGRAGKRLVAAAIAVALGGLSLWQNEKIRELESALMLARRQDAGLTRAPDEARMPAPQIRGDDHSSTPALPNDDHDEAPSAPSPLVAQQTRYALLGRYGPILTSLKLPPEKFGKFKELVLEKDRVRLDMREAAAKVGVDSFSPEWHRAARETESAIENEIRTLLGEDSYNAYLALEEKHDVERWKQTLSESGCLGYFIDTGLPLTANQADSLALVHHRLQRAGVLSSEAGLDASTGLSTGQTAVLAHAAEILTADQIGALHRYYQFNNRR